MSDAHAVGPGFFGKVPTHGDFVSRRLPPELVQRWDVCLQQGILHAAQHLGERWPQCYADAPLWHFVLGAGVCGDSAWAGVLMPSLDRVGRYFPLTIAAPMRPDALTPWLDSAQNWFDRICALGQSTLDSLNDMSTFDAALCVMPVFVIQADVRWRLRSTEIDIPGMASAETGLPELLRAWSVTGRTVWWSEDVHGVQGRLRAGFDLPTAAQFIELFDTSGDAWSVAAVLKNEAYVSQLAQLNSTGRILGDTGNNPTEHTFKRRR